MALKKRASFPVLLEAIRLDLDSLRELIHQVESISDRGEATSRLRASYGRKLTYRRKIDELFFRTS